MVEAKFEDPIVIVWLQDLIAQLISVIHLTWSVKANVDNIQRRRRGWKCIFEYPPRNVVSGISQSTDSLFQMFRKVFLLFGHVFRVKTYGTLFQLLTTLFVRQY